jgi:hypothetical protein
MAYPDRAAAKELELQEVKTMWKMVSPITALLALVTE